MLYVYKYIYIYIYVASISVSVATLPHYGLTFCFKITLAYLSPVSRILTGQPHSNQRLRMVLVLNNKERITNQWIATGWTVPDSLAPRIPQGTQNRTLFFGTSSVRKKKQKNAESASVWIWLGAEPSVNHNGEIEIFQSKSWTWYLPSSSPMGLPGPGIESKFGMLRLKNIKGSNYSNNKHKSS